MSIQIWDNHNRQWLEPIAIFFGKENTIWKVQACLPGANPLTDGYYDIEGDALSKIAITGEISHNTGLSPDNQTCCANCGENEFLAGFCTYCGSALLRSSRAGK